MGKVNLPKNTFLGTLCKRGHTWNKERKSLRSTKQGKACIVCRREGQKLYYENNRDKINARKRLYERDSRLNLKDGYIKKLLGSEFNGYFTKELIGAKREIVKLHRMIRDRKR